MARGAAMALLLNICALGPSQAAPATAVKHQVMTCTGLAAGYPFDVWFVFDKFSDPRVPGYRSLGHRAMRVSAERAGRGTKSAT